MLVASVLLMALLIWIGVTSYSKHLSALPVPVYYSSSEELEAAVANEIRNTIPVLNTGSMAPVVPFYRDLPESTRVGRLVMRMDAVFEDIQPGAFVVAAIEPDGQRITSAFTVLAHQVNNKDRWGWIPDGIANSRADTEWRVTKENFVGIVEEVWVLERSAL